MPRRRLTPRFFAFAGAALAIAAAALYQERPTAPVPRPKPRPRIAWVLRWEPAGKLPAPTAGLAAAVGGSTLYAAGGETAAGSVNTVTTFGAGRAAYTLPFPVHDAGAAVLDSTLYVFGGGTGSPVSTVQAVGLGAAAPAATRPVPEPLSDLAAVPRAGAVYLVGGYTGTAWSPVVWRWTPTQGAVRATTLPVGLRYAGAAWYDNRLVVAGGLGPHNAPVDTVFAVNPETGRVARWLPLPVPVAYPALVAFQGRLYLLGGLTDAGPSNLVWQYDGPSRGWSPVSALPVATYDGAAATLGTRLFYLGGQTADGLTAAVWVAQRVPHR
jgi:hypothetical protein